MPSTISDRLAPGAGGVQPQPVPEPEPRTGDPIELGLQVLIELISLVEKPVDLEEERQALLALRAIYENTPLSSRGKALRDELDRCVQLVHRAQAQNLIDWIDDPAHGLDRLRPVVRTRHRRLLLLFILLAKTVGRVQEYQIPGILQDMTPRAWAERLDCDLNWLPRLLGDRRYFAVADLYLETAQQILFENLLIDPDGLAPEDFETWPWMRQVLHLRGWRSTWSLHQTGNPAHHAHRLEYDLARRGAYRRLAFRGGRLARRTLANLQYRDMPRPRAGWPRLRLAVLAVLFAVTAGCWWFVRQQANDLVTANETILSHVDNCLEREVGHE